MAQYSHIIRAHFNAPRNVGYIEEPDMEGFAGGVRAGPFMRFSVRLHGDTIQEIKFQTFGCAPAIAAGSFLTEALVGKTLFDAKAWTVPTLVDALGGLPADKLHCATLAVAALQSLTKPAQPMKSVDPEN
jgi:nitrogen fixation NifU-like protein